MQPVIRQRRELSPRSPPACSVRTSDGVPRDVPKELLQGSSKSRSGLYATWNASIRSRFPAGNRGMREPSVLQEPRLVLAKSVVECRREDGP